jgi:glucose-6-phosphate isomerase
MITKREEELVLTELSELFDITDVYFHKGVLFVINAYDIPAVEDYAEIAPAAFKYRYVKEDEYV